MKKQFFRKANPIFAAGKTLEKNTQITLMCEVAAIKNAVLHIAARSFYQVYVNDRFLAFGPARTAKGYARVDEISLANFSNTEGILRIRIEVAGYACRSLSLCLEESFICAEITAGEEILFATDADTPLYLSAHRVQKTERYSMQRQFSEIVDMRVAAPFSEDFRVMAAVVDGVRFLPRVAPYPTYRDVAAKICSFGTFQYDESLPCKKNRYSSGGIDERWGRYEEEAIPLKPFRWIQKQRQTMLGGETAFPITLHAGDYVMLDLSRIEAGFFTWRADISSECDAVLGFSELCDAERFAFTDINCQNVIEYLLPVGEVKLMSFEPYTARFAVLMVRSGVMTLKDFGVKTYERDMSKARICRFHDPVLDGIYEAALATFAHNAVDLFSDCPSRERAGWLCDSYFTGKAEDFFFGTHEVETAFLENYRLFENEGDLPDGALPMCYPSDRENGNKFIPQWDMWYVLEVKEYLTEREPLADRELFRASVMGILQFLSRYENEDGLLEDLPSWNFVEWSKANEWTKNVNYPTNFLYAEVLSAAYALYGDDTLMEKAAHIRRIAAEQSFDGEVFIDHAVRDEHGALVRTRNSSEAGQYYAALFGGINLEDARYAALKAHILNGFDAFAVDLGDRGFVPVNAFIGRYLRMMTLEKMGEKALLLENIRAFFGGMASLTGTLWEYKEQKGSYDHGFASYVAPLLLWAIS